MKSFDCPTRNSSESSPFQWVNTVTANPKTAIRDTCYPSTPKVPLSRKQIKGRAS
jgi:hypothetical protein